MQTWLTTKILLDPNKKETDRFLFKSYTCDSHGNILDETEFDPSGKVAFKRIYRYFDTGAVQEFHEFNPLDQLLERHLFTENEFGDIVKVEYEFEGGHKSIKEFSVSDIGDVDRVTIRDEKGNITGFEMFLFDEQGLVKEEIELDAANNEISRIEKAYNESGNLILEKCYQDGSFLYTETIEYDENGNEVKKSHKNHPDNFETIDTLSYDENNNLVHLTSHRNGVKCFENSCCYDENNTLVSEEFYELDFWTKRIVMHEKRLHELENDTSTPPH